MTGDLSIYEICLRMLLAGTFAGFIGFDREFKNIEGRNTDAYFSLYWCCTYRYDPKRNYKYCFRNCQR